MNTPNNPTPTIVDALKAICSEFAQTHPLIIAARAALLRAEGESREGAQEAAYLRRALDGLAVAIESAIKPADGPDRFRLPSGRWLDGHDGAEMVRLFKTMVGGIREALAQPHHPTAIDEKEEHAQLQVIDERDNAESALGEAYRVATGREPNWSNLFGYADAVREIGEAANHPTASVEAVRAEDRPFVEAYTARSTFFRLLGDGGRALAEAFIQADRENQNAIQRLVIQATAHSLVEHYGYTWDEAIAALTAQQHPGLGSGGLRRSWMGAIVKALKRPHPWDGSPTGPGQSSLPMVSHAP